MRSPPRFFAEGRGAVSFTYDDSLDCHPDLVAPALEARGFRGTFYTPVTEPLLRRWDDWAALAARGHGLGTHTLIHPCRGHPGAEWRVPARDLRLYDLKRWEMEVDLANLILDKLEGRAWRTFGNTCHHNTLGPDGDETLLDDHMRPRFLAARGTCRGPGQTLDPTQLHLGNLGTLAGDNLSPEQWIAAATLAAERGHWVIFTFHHVGPVAGRLTIAGDTHNALLNHCLSLADRLDVAPVRDVVEHLEKG